MTEAHAATEDSVTRTVTTPGLPVAAPQPPDRWMRVSTPAGRGVGSKVGNLTSSYRTACIDIKSDLPSLTPSERATSWPSFQPSVTPKKRNLNAQFPIQDTHHDSGTVSRTEGYSWDCASGYCLRAHSTGEMAVIMAPADTRYWHKEMASSDGRPLMIGGHVRPRCTRGEATYGTNHHSP